MKSFCLLLSLLLAMQFSFAQQYYLDSLRKQLNNAAKQDTFRVKALSAIADYYGFVQADSCLFYATKAAELSNNLNYEFGKVLGYRSKFFAFNCAGNFPMALEQALKNEEASEQFVKDGKLKGGGHHYFVGFLYREMGDYPAAIAKLEQTINLQRQAGAPLPEVFFAYSQMGLLYLSKNQLDSALCYAQQGYDLGARTSKYFKKFYSLAIETLGEVEVALHNYKLAESLFRNGIVQSGQFNNIYFQVRNYYNLANLFDKENLEDSAIYYGGISLRLSLAHNFAEFTLYISNLLTKIYDSEKNTDSTLKYMRLELAAKDSVFSQSKGQQFRQTAFNEVERQQKINVENERHKNKVRLYTLVSILGVFLLLAFILYRNSLQRKKANLVLQEQKTKVENTLSELRLTQQQLIQSEKMASLGELTAGIAHEIQNPLNFVNNFSEVNNELVEEIKNENNIDEIKAIADDIRQNSEKILFHGKRADAIVKGMLQHSRQTKGIKEPTDINALCDEYLRLSYHGLRAKDKGFNADFKANFDEGIGMINIVPQDIGRVLLNLFNNAFYEVNEKFIAQGSKLDADYKPLVSFQTKKVNDKVEIIVSDNGNGIPQSIVNKIFQPFFTTKPTGQGTGLGLSLVYDIITKEHNGTIKVESKEGEGSVFMIQLPV